MRRVLVPGGVLVLTTPNLRYAGALLELVVEGRFPRTSGERRVFRGGELHSFTFRDVRELLIAAGFGAVEEFTLARWRPLAGRGRVTEAIKSLAGERLRREFFSAAVVVRAVNGPEARTG
jgi:hypothetical protein